MSEFHTLLSGLAFGESPRWHDDRLWFSDFDAREVSTVDLEGKKEVIARVAGAPMGLGFLPDGRLLIVSMRDGLLLCQEHDGRLVTHAELSSLSRYPWSDMAVDGRGNAYIGNLGFNFPGGEFAPGSLVLVTPDGEIRQVADGCAFPNGMVVTPDNATLILAESYGHRLTAFDMDASGNLSNRRLWADLGTGYPDGICLDAENAVWYADVPARRCVRVRARRRRGGADHRTRPWLLRLYVGRRGQKDPVSDGGGVSTPQLGARSETYRPGSYCAGASAGRGLAVI